MPHTFSYILYYVVAYRGTDLAGQYIRDTENVYIAVMGVKTIITLIRNLPHKY